MAPSMAGGVGAGELQENFSFRKIPKIRTNKISSFIYGLDQDTELFFFFFL